MIRDGEALAMETTVMDPDEDKWTEPVSSTQNGGSGMAGLMTDAQPNW